MADRPIVFAPQEPMRKDTNGRWVSKGLNLAATAEYGDLLIMWSPDASVLSYGHVMKEARSFAESYDEERDWLVAVGSPSLIAAFAHAIGIEGKRLRILEWDRAAQRYASTFGPRV